MNHLKFFPKGILLFLVCIGTISCFRTNGTDRDKSDISFMMSEAYNITSHGATIRGGAEISGKNEKIVQYGICYIPVSENKNPTLDNYCIDDSNPSCTTIIFNDTTCEFTCVIDDIESNSEWKYRVYVVLEAVWDETSVVYNSSKTFTTTP